jgi:DNA-directed RNA polymerase subunit M/transcription elongation factor TFIIS
MNNIQPKIIQKNEESDMLKTCKRYIHSTGSFTLSYDKYYTSNYNNIRRAKIILFSECLGECPSLDNIKLTNEKKHIYKLLNTILPSILKLSNTHVIKTITSYLYKPTYNREYIAKNLERACLNKSLKKAMSCNIRCIWENLKFVDIYHDICYKIAVNIDENSLIQSDYIKKKLVNSIITINDIVNMSSRGLCPKKYEKFDKKIKKRSEVKQKIKYSGLYECPKCKRTRCVMENCYNRGLDEGVSIKITCFCGHHWIE